MRLSRLLLVTNLLISSPTLGDDIASRVPSKTEAADLAAELSEEAMAVRLDVRSDADAKMQSYIDQVASVATLLDTEIRAGADKRDTRELYLELRNIRLRVLELARSGRVTPLPSETVARLKEISNELGRYHADAK